MYDLYWWNNAGELEHKRYRSYDAAYKRWEYLTFTRGFKAVIQKGT